MRNYFSTVPCCRCISIPINRETPFDLILEVFIEAFEHESGSFTPSEQDVLDGFQKWLSSIRLPGFQAGNFLHPIKNGAFVYTNVNTGFSLVFAACAADGDFPFQVLY